MHYLTFQLVPRTSRKPVEDGVALLRQTGLFFLVGGRWTGVLRADYNPEKDLRNVGPCPSCQSNGALGGDIMWPRPGSTQSTLFAGEDCKACDGRGFSLLSTHNWAPFPGDVMPVSELPDEYITPAIVITTEGQQHEMSYPANDANKQAWEEELSGLLSKNADCFVVVADLRR